MGNERRFDGAEHLGKIKTRKDNKSSLSFRWIAATVISLHAFLNFSNEGLVLFETISILVIYNGFLTFYAIKGKLSKNMASWLIYIDIILLCFFVFRTGGIDSDIYVLLVLALGYYGIFNSFKNTIKIGVSCIVAYVVSCAGSAMVAHAGLNYAKLATKSLILAITVFGVLSVNREIRKFDELRKREFKLARTDRLTGLANRHYFDQKIKEEVNYSDFTGMPLNVLMFDIDNFKKFNDTYGHVLGDKLLILFSDIIKQNIRNTDIPVRYGGEEFLILIRELDVFIAKNIGERIRRQLEKQQIYIDERGERVKVTVSCGIAQYPKDSTDIREVIEYADIALYHAKKTGKNTVVVYEEVMNL